MADFEDRLSRELRSRAEGAPAAEGLAASARTRLRRRRTTSAAVAAAVLAVVAVPVGLGVLPGGAGPRPGPATRPSATATTTSTPTVQPDGYQPAPPGWRWETGDGLQALVPDSWGYGVDVTSPCNRQADAGVPGAVEVPGMHTLVGCTGPEAITHYVSMLRFSADPAAPARETTGRWTTRVVRLDGKAVTVRSDDPAELARIVSSISVVHGADHNGCPVRTQASGNPEWRPRPLQLAPGQRPDLVTVCRYGSVDRPGRDLSFSTVLSDRRAAAVLPELVSARPLPAGGPRCAIDAVWRESVVVIRARYAEGWQDYAVHFDGCTTSTDDGRTRRELTRQVARAALIGYRGAVPLTVGKLVGNWMRDNHR
ncbi:MAG: hypothetical protein ACXVWU_13250 [Nocardioides sp.]